MIKLLAVDMDGTCLDERSRMTEETLSALKKAADKGIEIVPTTGRNLTCLPHKLTQSSNIYRYVITSNGAEIVDCLENTSIFQEMISKDTALSFLGECNKKEFGFAAHLNHDYLIQGKILRLIGLIIYGKDAVGVHRVQNMCQTIKKANADVEEIQLYFLKQGAREKAEEILKKYPELTGAYTKAYVEIYSKGASKGTALKALGDRLGISREEIACIGDGENDLSMFEAAGLRLAMGNAVEALKEKADFVLPANTENGAAVGIERYIL